jgi:AAA+ ATPase superfamily predicted ATPase
MHKFVGRSHELHMLDQLWDEQTGRMVMLYGRRRVGKSRLLTHWARLGGKRVLYWQADTDTADNHLRQFSQALFSFANPGFPAPPDFTYATWEQALFQAAQMAQTERLGLFIDEFTYLITSDPALPGKIQKIWDQTLQDSNLLLVFSGSHLGMMEREFLSERAPLFGRASVKHMLAPLSFGLTSAYFPDYSAEERMQLYTIFGGIPFYWDQVNPAVSVETNLKQKVFTTSSLLDAEARLLLTDYLKELHNYVSILRAIAHGNNTLGEIARSTGLSVTSVPKYLASLASAGYVTHNRSVIPLAGSTRVGRYYITDPFLRFYFRFLASRRTQLALNEPGQALAEYRAHMPDFIGSHTWEEVCREWVLRAANRGILPLYPDEVESAWTKEMNIDVVGVNTMRRHLILGECKWKQTPLDEADLQRLVEKSAAVTVEGGGWKVFLIGFSKSGFSRGAQNLPARMEEVLPGVAGCELVDLARVDADLAEWAQGG